jgi:single-stranded DNA-binding protein
LAEVCAEYLRKDRGVRIVGQLHEENDRIWIVAEHVEFKPTAKEKG